MTAARAILKMSRQKKPTARKVVGLDYKLLVFLKRVLPNKVVESLLGAVYLGKKAQSTNTST